MESVFSEVRDAKPGRRATPTADWCRPTRASSGAKHGTAVSMETLKKIADAHTTFPDGFTVHPKVMPQLQRRAAAITQGPIDWATGGDPGLRIAADRGPDRPAHRTGQPARHVRAALRLRGRPQVTGESWVPLKHLDDDQGKFHIFDSLLSEYAAMGFEYGYSVARPEALVLWEAQFGDFANGAQTIIDEFISSGQAKWTQKSGVVLLLPHGYEGQGPDHSSARIERWLQLAAEDSITVAQPSTPASHFHLLRQQALGEMHRPLVVMTPKSMLRNKLAVSEPADFTERTWRPVLRDPVIDDPDAVKRVILCSGKVRWDLINKRAQLGLQRLGGHLAGRAALPAAGPRVGRTSSAASPKPSRRCAGCRTSRRTKAPGPSWRSTCPAARTRPIPDSTGRSLRITRPPRRHPRWARPRCTKPSSASCSRPRSAS